MDTFGEWLRGQRTDRKLTREEFSNRVGCSVAMLRKIEDGERRPSAQIAELIANCLDIPSDERGTFIKVARGELPMNRLKPVSQLNSQPNRFASTSLSKSNLPVLPTPLIGRHHEVDELSKLLNDSQCRMVTISGPGGIGKTRLAIEAASQCQNNFTDGVYFVPLAPIQQTSLIVPTIAASIGFNFQGERSLEPKFQLFNHLKEKKLLLVVDNLEQLLVNLETVEFFSELMEEATEVKLLVTSRESLGLQREWIYEVHGLPIPASADVAGTSMELFIQRARRGHVEFDATIENLPDIVRICKLVHGIPLGIELAATWVRTLSCHEIADEIERSLDFLSTSAKDLPSRHRSMRAVFDHSWKLLSKEEQDVLLRLSVFQGGFQREAAQEVGGATLSILSMLVTKSLIRRSGSKRYDQHEVLRQFVYERLQEDTQGEISVRNQHCVFFTTLLEQIESRLKSADQNSALALLDLEVDNLRLAWDWAVVRGNMSALQKSTPCLQWFYDLRGWLHNSATMLKQAAETLENDYKDKQIPGYSATHSMLTIYEGLATVRSGRVAQGRLLLQNNLETALRLSDPKSLSDNLAFLGLADYLTGNYEEAHLHLGECLDVSRSIPYDWITSFSLMILGMVAQMKGEFSKAEAYFREGLALGRLIGSPRNIGSFLIMYSALLHAWKRHREANDMLRESLAIGRAENDLWLVAISLQHLNSIANRSHESELPQMQKMMEESVALFRSLGDRWGLAMSLTRLGEILVECNQYNDARHYFLEAMQKSVEARVMPVTLDVLVSLAAVYFLDGSHKTALELLNITLQHPAGISQETRDRAEGLRVEIEGTLTSSEIESARNSTAVHTVESVVKEILEQSRDVFTDK